MRRRGYAFQEDLFESKQQQETQRQIQELDGLIARALRARHFDEAKTYTEKQEKLIQELMKMNNDTDGHNQNRSNP